MIRTMQVKDYEGVRTLWESINGFAIRSIDDSYEGIKRFLKRNPTTCVVAEENSQIIGTILCGHDGRRGYFYHVCVREDKRKHGIGNQMVKAALEALKKEQITKVSLIAFRKNEIGNCFWKEMGWILREDLNYYDLTLNDDNQTTLV
jgi:ribosomal protein S18 acetylase RimI-like enzyme